MAKHEPKLGDVRYRTNPKNARLYKLYAFLGGKWVLMAHGVHAFNAAVHKQKLAAVLSDIIREARETNNGKG